MEDEDYDLSMPIDPPLSELIPLPTCLTYRNTKDGFEYTLLWEADGCWNTDEHGVLYTILMDHEGDLFVLKAEEFTRNFTQVPLNEHPQQTLF